MLLSNLIQNFYLNQLFYILRCFNLIAVGNFLSYHLPHIWRYIITTLLITFPFTSNIILIIL